ncbi:MAG TPA: adenylate/guanylate cyclase domain-containing protein, partial [Anaerolinea sp.]|nr:adenylate/guanylate cyclase domain-containing protein [Anaerolinea sp.]
MCGTRLGKECSSCGQSNPWEYLFCGNCGQRLDELGIETGLAATGQAKTAAGREAGVAPGAALLEGERRVVTVLVADVTGSTNLLEELGNEAWVEMMNRVLLALEAEIYRYGGVVDQFRGDGLVAFFGSDVSNEDDAERAILAGLAMLQAIHRFNDDRVTKLASGIRLRVGVNSGEVIVASIGDKRQHREDTAMGIAIAVAARLESAALPGTVLASESAYQQALDKFTWEALGEISVKGLSQPLAVFRPTTVRLETDLAFNIEVFGNQIPLVGRDNELHRLNQHVELLKMGQGSLVLLNGETGIGKQALIAETRQYFLRQEALIADAESREVRQNEQINWLIGRCRSYNRNWPYSLWVELLLNWLNSYTGQRPEEIADRLMAECKNLWGDEYNRYFPHLAELLHLSLLPQYEGKSDNLSTEALRQQFLENVENNPSDASRQQIADAVSGWLKALAGRSPLVVVLSEVEWADPSSLHMIKTSAGLAERCPVFFIVLYRDEPDSVLGDTLAYIRKKLGDLSEEVTLNPLGSDDCNQLIDQLIGADVLPVETRDLLVKNSEGNPSYIVEILRSWIDREVLVQNSETRNWCLSRPVNSAPVRGNLNRLLQARIDRLDDEERQTLQMAAVIGTIFWSNILQSVMGDQILVKEPLNALVKAQLIDRQGRNPELGWEYSFRTDLIHAVVYDSLLTSQREMFHLQVANSLEEISPENSGIQHQALIAFHYRRAREPRKELFYAIWAAEKAREVYAIEEAIEHYTRALELLDELGNKTIQEKQNRALCGQRFEVLNGRQSARFQ